MKNLKPYLALLLVGAFILLPLACTGNFTVSSPTAPTATPLSNSTPTATQPPSTATHSPTPTGSMTAGVSASQTPTYSLTPTGTPPPIASPTPSSTPVLTSSPTFTPVFTVTATSSPTVTFTRTPTPTGSATPTPTVTGLITTVAGDGTAGLSGNGSAATSAELNYPGGVVVDATGNFYIADTENNVIRKVQGGVISTYAGNGTAGYSGDNGPATSAELDYPEDVVLDSAGDLYITDDYNNCVRRVSAAGTITTVAGNGNTGFSGDGGPATSAELDEPYGLALDSSGNLYIADEGNSRVRMVSAGGTITTVAGTGAFSYSGDGGPATLAALQFPQAVAVDASGNLYIADSSNDRIREVTAGIIKTVAGDGAGGSTGDGGPATLAELDVPYGIAVDSSGDIFIGDTYNEKIREVSAAGTITTYAGDGTGGFAGDGGPPTSAELYFPCGVALDSSGDLYIADFRNHRIRKVIP